MMNSNGLSPASAVVSSARAPRGREPPATSRAPRTRSSSRTSPIASTTPTRRRRCTTTTPTSSTRRSRVPLITRPTLTVALDARARHHRHPDGLPEPQPGVAVRDRRASGGNRSDVRFWRARPPQSCSSSSRARSSPSRCLGWPRETSPSPSPARIRPRPRSPRSGNSWGWTGPSWCSTGTGSSGLLHGDLGESYLPAPQRREPHRRPAREHRRAGRVRDAAGHR